MTRMKHLLEPAYRAAWYYFWWKGRSERIHPGQPLALLLPLMPENTRHWIWITAANPGSTRLSSQENRWRNLLLQQHIQTLKLPHGPAWSGSDQADWPVESGFWLITTHPEPVFRLGQHFGQQAVLLGRRDRPAALHWLNPAKS